ncbi:GntR family transcriptional regulator [Clostridium aminobutyricum]|uniref:GntR family transcriptional regulator n=1 Tax=Clostridium aminobutyricum TaxID=33953 RepID=A0A939D8T2_CLOAM|nr:GntR family transcriptional regulator [Clostridium aminobutyricum]MBN7773195.1 GntR family transcriptional regulator [Clostridium aminobutyricum]
MNLIISNSRNQPIYEQIVEQIKNMIITKELKEGDSLPSMRLLAKELHISVITTKRAYEELEREGFIASQTGRGSFVKPQNVQQIREVYLKEIEKKMDDLISLAKLSGIELSELIDMLALLYKGE